MACVRHDDAPEDAPVADAERLCCVDHIPVKRLKRPACRAIHERQAHNDRRDDRRPPRKDERQIEREQGASDGAALSQEEQQEESNDGRRQNERQRDDGIGNRTRKAAAELEHTIGERDAEEEGHHRRKACDFK